MVILGGATIQRWHWNVLWDMTKKQPKLLSNNHDPLNGVFKGEDQGPWFVEWIYFWLGFRFEMVPDGTSANTLLSMPQ